MAECPLCEATLDVDVDELDEGDSLVCEECGATLTVTNLDPLELEESGEEFDEEDEEELEEEDEDDPWRRSTRRP
jgi:alpha-aminoadipate carrier protein LysW